ncbi:conserved hypothetical protein [Alkaliphilus metalliredigens QYMF]|uniref:DUF340 domain-containing protein n=1 Tax=Alkaliphilus metalliredigens (strain QYMF) TaxID=293826 RepID=A6TR04_ALKMQ|nr:LysO family transporter [Alkaliphilus metalliredigens]ABR48622.1 conserved hypothetical protein [Alkaliphilus metalliredigens QYMF]
MNILFYLIILVLGATVGYKKLLSEQSLEKLSKLQNVALLFLLFIMGINIGLDRDIIASFGVIGFQAVLLAVSSIIFSVIGVRLVSKRIDVGQKGEEVGHDH